MGSSGSTNNRSGGSSSSNGEPDTSTDPLDRIIEMAIINDNPLVTLLKNLFPPPFIYSSYSEYNEFFNTDAALFEFLHNARDYYSELKRKIDEENSQRNRVTQEQALQSASQGSVSSATGGPLSEVLIETSVQSTGNNVQNNNAQSKRKRDEEDSQRKRVKHEEAVQAATQGSESSSTEVLFSEVLIETSEESNSATDNSMDTNSTSAAANSTLDLSDDMFPRILYKRY